MSDRARPHRATVTAGRRSRGRWSRWWRLARRRLRRHTRREEVAGGWLMLALAAVIGATSGLAIVAFYGSVDLIGAGVRAAAGWIATGKAVPWSPLLVLPLGLMAARWLRPPEDRERGGTMIPQLILSAAGRGGDLRARHVGRGLLSAAVTLGTGGPLGSEGPVALAGGTVGSMAGRFLGFRPGRVKVLLACGAAAGISAAFHAPIAGTLVAAAGIAYPELSGPGREGSQLMLFGQLAGASALLLGLMKIVASGLTMGGGGGVFTPSLFVGACVLSYLTADRLSGESLYSVALDRQGEKIRHGVDLSVLQSVRVAECYDRDPVTLRRESPFREILRALRESGQLDFPVVSEDGRLVGVISYQQLARALAEQELADLLVAADLMLEDPEKVEPDDSLLLAMQRMSARDLDFIPVVEDGDEGKLVGLLRRADIMETYQAHLMLPG